MMQYLFIVCLVLCWTTVTSAAGICINKSSAKVASLQGGLLVDAAGKENWQAAQLNDEICEGSRIHVQANSRASIVLPNVGMIRASENTTLKFSRLNAEQTTLIDMVKGFIHFISRTPKKLEINTPIANAGPEGTEFAITVNNNNAALWVYEGAVKFYNQKGSIQLKPGQGAQAQLGFAPIAKIDITPEDAVKWALYYPPLLPEPANNPVTNNPVNKAIQAYRQGRVDLALNQLDAIAPPEQSPYFYKVRGAIRLTVGQDNLALQDIQTALANNPNDAEALALQSVRALSQNRKDEAFALANKAVTANPKSANAFTALSYAEQGRFNLVKAQTAADQAVKFAPQDGLVWARKAELELSQGLTADSEQSVQHAVKLDPKLERTKTVLGFAQLIKTDTQQAINTFEQAILLDSTSPLPRLGLGLAKIRNGNLADGRQDLEIAAVLDPNNAIVRSYLGKAYYEERRSDMADTQFGLAKVRDPKDPTPYFYNAINKQTTNRPVEALQDMQKAIALNDNRGVYRSSLALDKDAAARTANMARIYNDLGFGRVALKEAWKSLNFDSIDPSAHRFLSDTYVGQPRYRIARASELLQAQLLQPINITPVQPQLTSENIGILNSTGPGNLSLNEYDPLYNNNGVHLVLNGAYGSRNTKTDNAIISGIYNNFSGSLGQFHYQNDGFRQNDAYKQDIYNAFAQYAITPDLSVQMELKSEDIRAGDVPFRLNDINTHQENLNKTIEHDTIRVGGHYRISPTQDLIVSGFYTTIKEIETNSKTDSTFDNGDKVVIDSLEKSHESGYQTELQYNFHPATFDLTAGAGYINLGREEASSQKQFFIPLNNNPKSLCGFTIPDLCNDSSSQRNTNYVNGYIYSKQYLLPTLTTTLGFSYDSYNDGLIERNQFNPKFGAVWNPLKSLTLRSAVFRSIKRPLASSQTIEPTQVAGFNQFYDGNNGATFWQGGFGLDYNPVKSVFLGGEVTWRDGKQAVSEQDILIDQSRNESAHLAYLYWAPADWMAIRAEYRYDKISRDFTKGIGDDTNPRSIETQQVPLSVNLYHSSGLFSRIMATYINQQVEMVNDSEDDSGRVLPPLGKEHESFWTFDAALGYRLPKKIGIISFEVRNLFDNKFNFQSAFDASGPQLTPFIPERQLFGKISLFF